MPMRISKLSLIADPDTFISNPGDPVHILYAPAVDDSCVRLVPAGKQYIPDIINAAAELCDMNYILSRLNAGDASVLTAREAFYGDASAFSYNSAEFLQQMMDIRAMYDRLPDDTKARFSGFQDWISTVGSDAWSSKMCPPVPAVNEPVKVEVPVSES
nr:virion structural protein [Microvirus sp.]